MGMRALLSKESSMIKSVMGVREGELLYVAHIPCDLLDFI